MSKLYYTPPEEKIFKELKNISMVFWKEKYPEAEHPFYAPQKINKIKDLRNVGDNFMYILAMYDMYNQREVILRLSDETKEAIRLRLVDGGSDKVYLLMIGL
jgi:hypothetical protein